MLNFVIRAAETTHLIGNYSSNLPLVHDGDDAAGVDASLFKCWLRHVEVRALPPLGSAELGGQKLVAVTVTVTPGLQNLESALLRSHAIL